MADFSEIDKAQSMKDTKIATLILAAGSSERFGKPKQLAVFNGKTFIRRAIETALEAGLGKVFVVLGANSELIHKEVSETPAEVVINKNWQEGITSSLQAGLRKVLEIDPQISGLLVMLCDQPLVNSSLVRRLADAFTEKKSLIVASKYSDTVGVPAIFSSELFEDIFQLRGKSGAKELIIRYESRTEKINATEASLDIDTAEDYESLLLLSPKSGG